MACYVGLGLLSDMLNVINAQPSAPLLICERWLEELRLLPIPAALDTYVLYRIATACMSNTDLGCRQK